MAASAFKTVQYSSEQFVESSGAILFDFSEDIAKVCLIHDAENNEWLLAKGRRNCNERRCDAALREVQEETGYYCRLYPVAIPTRAPATSSAYNIPDQARVYHALTEPFMLSTRELGKYNVKLIWWYIAELEKGVQKTDGERGFTAQFFRCGEAIQRLTFRDDRDVLAKAVSLVNGSRKPTLTTSIPGKPPTE
ncbi:NUDIX domain-containing [Trichophyton interdigitale]|nr:NUDIX domain-containing [Trichophyton interdigitale]KAG5218189.1 NUDIX domain-containing [Trichophyton interdigitale]KAG8207551.1 NUDIX domain-containing [Trichophyton interdigitale]